MDQFKSQASLKPYFDTAYGYAVFGTIAKAGFGVGGAGGKGDVYINNKDGTEKRVGSTQVFQLSVGFQFGAQVYSEIIFFETEKEGGGRKFCYYRFILLPPRSIRLLIQVCNLKIEGEGEGRRAISKSKKERRTER